MTWIELDLDKSIEENAEAYFEEAKKMKKKKEGAKKAIENFKRKLEELEKKEEAFKARNSSPKKERKRKWYEKYHWFFSSEGFLVIAGRDSTTNEILIKKHTEKDDIVLHTDMSGSPFTVIKTEGKKPSEQTLQEAADFTVSFSNAWKKGLASIEVFHVSPEQVTKEPNSGEYLPKGAFVIRGKVNYLLGRINLAIGLLKDGRAMIAPLSAVEKNCKSVIKIFPGKSKTSEVAKKIQAKLKYDDLDEIIRLLPSGGVDLK
jgi:predicted ribosome quality control (RQC) complex YloA/Tae2 family protein